MPQTNKFIAFFKKTNIGLYLIIFTILSISTLIVYYFTGTSIYLISLFLLLIVAYIALRRQIQKIEITTEEIDKWNEELKTKKYKGEPIKIDDFKKYSNKFSFWIHKISLPKKIFASLALIVSFASIASLPILYSTGIGYGTNVTNQTYSYRVYEITFNENGVYSQKMNDEVVDSGTWSQEKTTVTCNSNGGITFTFFVYRGYIKSMDGNVWQKI